MDIFENEDILQPQVQAETEPEELPQQPPEPGSYRGAGTGRKESPYAHSPYVMQHEPVEHQTEKPQKVKKERAPRKLSWKGILAGILAAAVAIGGWVTAFSINEHWEEETADMAERFSRQISDLQERVDSLSRQGSVFSADDIMSGTNGLTPAQLYNQCVNSVVAISTTLESYMYGQVVEGSSGGSGFILTEDGYVVTNYHVVEGAAAIDVVTHDGSEYPAELVGYDSTNDLAVLKVEAAGLSAAAIGSSSDLIIGDMVVAIGNPLGELTATQTVGYVSGIDRSVTTDNTIINMIQTDAAINPGNSGGPLFNMYGQVIGITTAKYSGTTSSGASIEGIGFAIPIDDVVNAISDLIDYGYVTGAYLGVTVQNMDEETASTYGLPLGAYVATVVDGACADRAGIQPKDIITDLGGYPVGNISDLTRALRNFKAGDTTTVTVFRSGAEKVLDITLDEKPADLNETAGTSESMPSGDYDEWYEYFRRYFGG